MHPGRRPGSFFIFSEFTHISFFYKKKGFYEKILSHAQNYYIRSYIFYIDMISLNKDNQY
jgi:hypothetical protein